MVTAADAATPVVFTPAYGTPPAPTDIPSPPPLPAVTTPPRTRSEKALWAFTWLGVLVQTGFTALAVAWAGVAGWDQLNGLVINAFFWGTPFWVLTLACGTLAYSKRNLRRTAAAQQEQSRRALVRQNDATYARLRADTEKRFEKDCRDHLYLDIALPFETATVQIHGEPGRGLPVGRFGAKAAAGQEGEQRTVAALVPVLEAHPGARLINGIQWPGTDHADIDHVLTLDEKIAVIDSKRWERGNYYWDGRKLYRDGQEMHDIKLAGAADALATRIGVSRTQVTCWVVVHADNGFTIQNADPKNTVRIVTPAALVTELTNWLADSPEVCNRWYLHRLLGLMVEESTVMRG